MGLSMVVALVGRFVVLATGARCRRENQKKIYVVKLDIGRRISTESTRQTASKNN